MPVCSKACLKNFWPEHKRVCQKQTAAVGADALAEQLEGLKLEQRHLPSIMFLRNQCRGVATSQPSVVSKLWRQKRQV